MVEEEGRRGERGGEGGVRARDGSSFHFTVKQQGGKRWSKTTLTESEMPKKGQVVILRKNAKVVPIEKGREK